MESSYITDSFLSKIQLSSKTPPSDDDSSDEEDDDIQETTIRESYICSICKKLLYKPIKIDCLHNFCEPCLTHNDFCNCPICNEPITNPIPNISLENDISKDHPFLYKDMKKTFKCYEKYDTKKILLLTVTFATLMTSIYLYTHSNSNN